MKLFSIEDIIELLRLFNEKQADEFEGKQPFCLSACRRELAEFVSLNGSEVFDKASNKGL